MAINYALATNGSTVFVTNIESDGFDGAGIINSFRHTNNNYGNHYAWSGGNSLPQEAVINFNQSRLIDEIDVFMLADAVNYSTDPTLTDTFTLYGVTNFLVQYWDGSAWVTVTGGAVTGNDKVWRKFTFSPVTTTKIRVYITASRDGTPRLVEVEAWRTVATVHLTWSVSTTPVSSVNGYDIQRSTNSSFTDNLVTIPITGGNVSQYDDTNRSVGTTLYYRIRSKNTGGFSSAYSSSISITP